MKYPKALIKELKRLAKAKNDESAPSDPQEFMDWLNDVPVIKLGRPYDGAIVKDGKLIIPN